MAFRGISNLNIDTKGRIAIPTKYRSEIASDTGGEMIVTIDHADHCLVLYTMSHWDEMEAKLMSLPSLSKNVRAMKRLIIGHASDVMMDKQGRIMLSAPLRKYARLDKKLVMVGQQNKFELWDLDAWDASCESVTEIEPLDIENDEALNGLSI